MNQLAIAAIVIFLGVGVFWLINNAKFLKLPKKEI